ncbi:MAG: pyridoxamine 5'-phosphate oxidase family protein [Phycisphaeraceae bacterium]|nr:pyridoxamine 5'-phosphate oxidase family protein [Phycisphaeraceae bacterium]
MGKCYAEIDARLREFILSQHVFFVATAPRGEQGHINVSPKGLDCLRILGPQSVGYVDYTGSGVETIAHIRENGRLTIMFCAFEGSPNIVRLYGRGRVVEAPDPEFPALFERGAFPRLTTARSIIVLDINRIADSCGFGVPRYQYVGERDQLVTMGDRRGPDGLAAYQRQKNAASIDGLPGLRSATADDGGHA